MRDTDCITGVPTKSPGGYLEYKMHGLSFLMPHEKERGGFSGVFCTAFSREAREYCRVCFPRAEHGDSEGYYHCVCSREAREFLVYFPRAERENFRGFDSIFARSAGFSGVKTLRGIYCFFARSAKSFRVYHRSWK